MRIELLKSTLRPWHSGDEDSLVRHANNYQVWRNVRDAFPHPYTRTHAEAWIASGSKAPSMTNFAIEVHGDAVGGIGLVLKDDVNRISAEIGYWLGEEYWGRGIITEAVRAVTEYGFANLDIHRIYAGVFEWNAASMRVLEKAGYQLEARLRKAVIKEGHIIDEYVYAIIRS